MQEALANVTKHARATKVRVEIQRNSSNVRCSISDNGQGMDVPAVLRRQGERGLGLIGIRERLDPFRGTVDLKSAPGRGTEVIITVPLEAASWRAGSSGVEDQAAARPEEPRRSCFHGPRRLIRALTSPIGRRSKQTLRPGRGEKP